MLSFWSKDASQCLEDERFLVLNGASWFAICSSHYAMPVNIASPLETTAFKPDPDKSGYHDLLSVPCGFVKPT